MSDACSQAHGASDLSRRDFLCSVAGCAAAAGLAGCADLTHTAWHRANFRELEKHEIAEIVADLERKHSETYGKDVTVATTPARPGVEFGYALDLSRCVGCRRCVYACVEENNQSRDPHQIHWIRVLEMDKDRGIDFAHANAYYGEDAQALREEAEAAKAAGDEETHAKKLRESQVPREGHFYVPVACQQCRDAPCVKTCPVGATWQEPDGIVVIDYDWCIGCRCCMAACPYGARHFNWAEPDLAADQMNPDTHYLGNRPRPRGVVEKCTFCIQRVRNGRYPACVEVCPVGARKFGDLHDPNSEVRYVLEHKRVFVLKAELNTRPRFYYFYGL